MIAVSATPTLGANISFESFSPGRVLECRVAIIVEDDGYSAHALDLPGAVSQGDTIDEAVLNITEALQGIIAEYRSSGGRIPWSKVEIEGEKICEKRILVDA